MKSKFIPGLIVGLLTGAVLIWFLKPSDPEQIAETGQKEEDAVIQPKSILNTIDINMIDDSFDNVLSFGPSTEPEAVKWVQDFERFNRALASQGSQLEPSLWGKNVAANYPGNDVPCGIGSWFISKKDFDVMYSIQNFGGFKVYPAIRNHTVTDTRNGGTFQHAGFTLIFSPTDDQGKSLTNNSNSLITFEYVDPCPNVCKIDQNDLLAKAGVNVVSCP